jgi:hypothetical protein
MRFRTGSVAQVVEDLASKCIDTEFKLHYHQKKKKKEKWWKKKGRKEGRKEGRQGRKFPKYGIFPFKREGSLCEKVQATYILKKTRVKEEILSESNNF